MEEKTILVTGSTDGIGKATALMLAGQGHRVLVHGRNREKGRAVLTEIRERTAPDRADLLIADLSGQQRIRELAGAVIGEYGRLDVLINNAGVYLPDRTVAPGGIEMTLAVNFLAPFLLTHELLPLLEQSAPARIVNVASIAHRSARRIGWESLRTGRDYHPYDAYAISKLGLIAFTKRLARMLEGGAVTACALHPGVIDTKLLRAFDPYTAGDPPEAGAKAVAYVAVSPDLQGVNGEYFEEGRPVSPSRLSRDPAVQERFWELGMDLLGLPAW
ncbi:MAG: SDR family NAD(P)-dependent oxidoreductase [Methanomicrobiaceae archaeon]|uniref:Retinol dehydrogenase 11 n=1 Tax=hydrocarbon metagenome TaxID=938273 RepID=A0A0W8FKJ7_9ZZZZ|nr:SDR family NAD(P)-dependent oxidoreductase [Methanomicrobiaceae archaeon]MDD5418928.1 SDR family NAD(P)-dependent oxidoreductase [Methanomicrobiaceae archaeon]